MNKNPSLFHKTMPASMQPAISEEIFFAAAPPKKNLKKNFRVAHILRKLNYNEWGGTETAIQRLADGLSQNDVESIIFCPRLKNKSRREAFNENGNVIKRFNACVPVIGISCENKKQILSVGGNLMSFDLPFALWREPEISLIHTHALGRLGSIAAMIARARRLPFVISIHGGLLDVPPAMKKNFENPDYSGLEWGKIFGLLLRSRKMLERADAILTCNPNEARLLREKFPRNRIQVQSHGIPLEPYEKNCRAAARAAFPQICDQEILLCVGRIDSVKNQDWIVAQAPEIFQNHPRALIVFAGAITDENYGEKFQQKIRELGLEQKMLLTGGLPPGDPRLIGLFQESRALILPSISETFGIVLLEAWAAGTTVISSRTSGASALVKHGENGWLFDLENPRAFHEALDATLFNSDLRAQLIANGNDLTKKFSVAAVAAQVKKLYEELIEKKCAT